MAHFDLPLRSRKDLARAAQLRNLANPTHPSLDDSYFPPPPSRAMWRRGINPGNMNINPYFTFNNPLNQPTLYPPQNNAFGFDPTAYGGPGPYTRCSNAYTDSDIRSSSSESNKTDNAPVSFPKAARALYEVLDAAENFTHHMQAQFLQDTANMRWYVDEATISHLWNRLITWDGHAISSPEPNPTTNNNTDPSPTHPPHQVFSTHAQRILRAIETWQTSTPLSPHEWTSLRSRGSVLREEDVRLAWRKLRVGCGAVEELLEGVKGERRRCPSLLRELASVRDALVGIREVWAGSLGGAGEGVGAVPEEGEGGRGGVLMGV
ncbi:hypothetical protein Q7P37_006522 [Cladosporium fusiforme]